jgi:serine/threonine-protein kinase
MSSKAKAAKAAKPEPTALEAAEKKISNAWWAGVLSAGVTLIFVFISFGGEPIAGIDKWAFLDVALILGLSFGVAQKSRTCAVLLLLYFVASKVLMWVEAGNVRGLPVALVFMWFFAQGVVGTFQYHGLEGSDAPGREEGGTPWLAWLLGSVVVVLGAAGAWQLTSDRRAATGAARAPPTQQELQAQATAAVGQLNRVEMSGATTALAAAIAIEEGVMLVPCRGILPGVQLFVRIPPRDIPAQLQVADDGTGLCKLAVKDVGTWPLTMAADPPKVGDQVYAASFDTLGRVVLSPGEVKKVTREAQGTAIESSARAGSPLEGSPLLDARGRIVAIALEGRDRTLPGAP